MASLIPSFEFQDEDGKPVKSPADPAWKYTVIGSAIRMVKDGKPQRLIDGKWQDIAK